MVKRARLKKNISTYGNKFMVVYKQCYMGSYKSLEEAEGILEKAKAISKDAEDELSKLKSLSKRNEPKKSGVKEAGEGRGGIVAAIKTFIQPTPELFKSLFGSRYEHRASHHWLDGKQTFLFVLVPEANKILRGQGRNTIGK